MSFTEHLQQIVTSVDGAIACSVMSFDGIAVETHHAPQAAEAAAAMELNSAWVEFANLLSQLRNAAESLKTGNIAELSVNTDKVITVIRMVNAEYFLVLGMLPSGNYGKGRYALRIAAPKVAGEL